MNNLLRTALTIICILVTPFRILLEPLHTFQSALFDYRVFTNHFERRSVASFTMITLFAAGVIYGGNYAYRNVQHNQKQKAMALAQQAFENKEYEVAIQQFNKLASYKRLYKKERYQQAVSLIQTGNLRRGILILRELTAKDMPVYEPAHKFMAVWLTRGEIDENSLAEIEYHLNNSGKPTAKTLDAKGRYLLAMNQPQEAIAALRKTTDRIPSNHLLVSQTLLKIGQKEKSSEELLRAEKIIYTELKTLKKEENLPSIEADKYTKLLKKLKELRKKVNLTESSES